MKKRSLLLILAISFFFSISKSQDVFEVDTLMGRIYTELTSDMAYSVAYWMLGECTTDNSEVGGQNVSDWPEFQSRMLFDISTCNQITESIWNRAYDVIMLSNKVIADISATSYSEIERKQIIAEATFLRSLF